MVHRFIFLVALRGLACLALPLALTSCPGDRPPVEPKPEIENVKITVLDRFEQPIPDLHLEVKREYSQPMSLQPFELVDSGRTDESGVVTFPVARVDDWVSESTEDNRFSGKMTLEEGKSEYVLKLNQARIGSTSTASDVPINKYDDVIEEVRLIMNKILAFYVAENQTGFNSLKHYVEKKVITRGEADLILKMAPRMNKSSTGINFGWGFFELRVADYNTPISWVED